MDVKRRKYIPPTIEIDEYKVERGYAASSFIDIDDPIERHCNCQGWDCECSKRSECKGSGVDGCHSKYRISQSYTDDLFYMMNEEY